MRRLIVRLLVAVGLLGTGWAAGRAQGTLPDFALVIDAPEGRTNVEWVKGCEGLAWVERMAPGTVPPPSQTVFSYGCSNSGNARCGSGRIGGWIKR